MAALSSVCNVTEALSGSSSRSSDARLVFMRPASAVLERPFCKLKITPSTQQLQHLQRPRQLLHTRQRQIALRPLHCPPHRFVPAQPPAPTPPATNHASPATGRHSAPAVHVNVASGLWGKAPPGFHSHSGPLSIYSAQPRVLCTQALG